MAYRQTNRQPHLMRRDKGEKRHEVDQEHLLDNGGGKDGVAAWKREAVDMEAQFVSGESADELAG